MDVDPKTYRVTFNATLIIFSHIYNRKIIVDLKSRDVYSVNGEYYGKTLFFLNPIYMAPKSGRIPLTVSLMDNSSATVYANVYLRRNRIYGGEDLWYDTYQGRQLAYRIYFIEPVNCSGKQILIGYMGTYDRNTGILLDSLFLAWQLRDEYYQL